jgi:hypothetical protein
MVVGAEAGGWQRGLLLRLCFSTFMLLPLLLVVQVRSLDGCGR